MGIFASIYKKKKQKITELNMGIVETGKKQPGTDGNAFHGEKKQTQVLADRWKRKK